MNVRAPAAKEDASPVAARRSSDPPASPVAGTGIPRLPQERERVRPIRCSFAASVTEPVPEPAPEPSCGEALYVRVSVSGDDVRFVRVSSDE